VTTTVSCDAHPRTRAPRPSDRRADSLGSKCAHRNGVAASVLPPPPCSFPPACLLACCPRGSWRRADSYSACPAPQPDLRGGLPAPSRAAEKWRGTSGGEGGGQGGGGAGRWGGRHAHQDMTVAHQRLNPQPYTLNPTTLHPQPHNPTPSALHPQPYTLSPTTLNPTPSTLHPMP
jgi:hypothetical protein